MRSGRFYKLRRPIWAIGYPALRINPHLAAIGATFFPGPPNYQHRTQSRIFRFCGIAAGRDVSAPDGQSVPAPASGRPSAGSQQWAYKGTYFGTPTTLRSDPRRRGRGTSSSRAASCNVIFGEARDARPPARRAIRRPGPLGRARARACRRRAARPSAAAPEVLAIEGNRRAAGAPWSRRTCRIRRARGTTSPSAAMSRRNTRAPPGALRKAHSKTSETFAPLCADVQSGRSSLARPFSTLTLGDLPRPIYFVRADAHWRILPRAISKASRSHVSSSSKELRSDAS